MRRTSFSRSVVSGRQALSDRWRLRLVILAGLCALVSLLPTTLHAAPDFFVDPPLSDELLYGVGQGATELSAVITAIVDITYQQSAATFTDPDEEITVQYATWDTEFYRVEVSITEVQGSSHQFQDIIRFLSFDDPVVLYRLSIELADGRIIDYTMFSPRGALSPSQAIDSLVRQPHVSPAGQPAAVLERIERSEGKWYALVSLDRSEL